LEKIFYIDLIHPDDYERVLGESREKLSNLNLSFHTYRILNKAGEIVWVEEFGDAVINNGKITYIEGIMLDITKEE
jgi:PAS domain S-box-containing protein